MVFDSIQVSKWMGKIFSKREAELVNNVKLMVLSNGEGVHPISMAVPVNGSQVHL
jgi:hypothetical protein